MVRRFVVRCSSNGCSDKDKEDLSNAKEDQNNNTTKKSLSSSLEQFWGCSFGSSSASNVFVIVVSAIMIGGLAIVLQEIWMQQQQQLKQQQQQQQQQQEGTNTANTWITTIFASLAFVIVLFVRMSNKTAKTKTKKTTKQVVVSIYPIGVQLHTETITHMTAGCRSTSSMNNEEKEEEDPSTTVIQKHGPVLFIPRIDIVDCIVKEIVLAHKVMSILYFRVRDSSSSTFMTTTTTPPTTSDSEVRGVYNKYSHYQLFPAFPGVEMTYEECIHMRHAIHQCLFSSTTTKTIRTITSAAESGEDASVE